jgi:hypothetical protein
MLLVIAMRALGGPSEACPPPSVADTAAWPLSALRDEGFFPDTFIPCRSTCQPLGRPSPYPSRRAPSRRMLAPRQLFGSSAQAGSRESPTARLAKGLTVVKREARDTANKRNKPGKMHVSREHFQLVEQGVISKYHAMPKGRSPSGS